MLTRLTLTSFHRNHISSFVDHLFFFFFSAWPLLFIPVYLNLQSIKEMYHRRYWEVSNLIPSLKLDQAGRKGEM